MAVVAAAVLAAAGRGQRGGSDAGLSGRWTGQARIGRSRTAGCVWVVCWREAMLLGLLVGGVLAVAGEAGIAFAVAAAAAAAAAAVPEVAAAVAAASVMALAAAAAVVAAGVLAGVGRDHASLLIVVATRMWERRERWLDAFL